MHLRFGEPGPTDPTRQRRPRVEPFVDERDTAERLTNLCHRAYAEHAAQGRRFFGSYQSVEDTRRRVQDGECWVAIVAGEFVGTVTVSGPGGFPPGYPATPQAGRFSQLAVDPTWRGTGLGHALLVHAERRLVERGCDAVVVDTSSAADELLAWYGRRGYAAVGRWAWSVTNYDSTVLRKELTDPDGPGTDGRHRSRRSSHNP